MGVSTAKFKDSVIFRHIETATAGLSFLGQLLALYLVYLDMYVSSCSPCYPALISHVTCIIISPVQATVEDP